MTFIRFGENKSQNLLLVRPDFFNVKNGTLFVNIIIYQNIIFHYPFYLFILFLS